MGDRGISLRSHFVKVASMAVVGAFLTASGGSFAQAHPHHKNPKQQEKSWTGKAWGHAKAAWEGTKEAAVCVGKKLPYLDPTRQYDIQETSKEKKRGKTVSKTGWEVMYEVPKCGGKAWELYKRVKPFLGLPSPD